jgi:ATP-binding cassette subfamily C protein LapB
VVALFEIVRSAVAVRVHNRQQDSLNRWRVQAARLHAIEASGQLWQALGQHITVTVAQLSFIAVLVVGAEMVMNGGLTVGVLVASSMLCSRAMTPALHLVDTLVRIQKIRAGLKQLRSGLNRPLEVLSTSDATPDFLPTCQGSLLLQNVGVTLPERPGRPALHNLNLRIAPGERWAVVGSNGAGKSTLLAALAGFVDPTAGTLHLDGVDYTRMPVSEVRRHVVLVPQQPSLPDVSVREVIAGMAPVNEVLMSEALDVSGFGHVLKELGAGLELRTGPDGERLSGGQRQMLALAAAIYRVPRVLLLDEPTSAFDPDAERHVTERLAAWLKRRHTTLVLVTHRVGLLELVDNMVVLAQGQLIYGGSKKDVMKKLRGGTVDA